MERKFVGVVVPPRETRKQRKARERQVRQLMAPDPRERTATGPNEPTPPAWGDRTPKSWWGPTYVNPMTHRATALTTSTAYPFLNEVGLGHRGAWMGKLGSLSGGGDFVFDPYELYRQGFVTGTSMVWIGTVGTGKSAGAKAFSTRMCTLGTKVAVASDPKGEWVGPALAMGGTVISLSPSGSNRLNPLDEGPRDSRLSDEEWHALVLSRRRLTLTAIIPSLIHRDLSPREHTALDVALVAAIAAPAGATVTITDVFHRLTESSDPQLREDGADVAHGLRRLVLGDLSGVFEGESTVKFDADSPFVVMDTSGFMGASATLLSVATTCVAAWLEAAVMDPAAGKRIVIYDEGWRMLRDEQMLLRMSEQWKLARQYGLCNLLIMHRITDLDMVGNAGSATRALAQGLLTDAEIRIVYRQEEDVLPATKEALGLTDAELREVRQLAQGVGLWKIGKRPFIVRNYLTEDELEAFKTSDRFEEVLPAALAQLDVAAEPATGWEADHEETQAAAEEARRLEVTAGRHRIELPPPAARPAPAGFTPPPLLAPASGWEAASDELSAAEEYRQIELTASRSEIIASVNRAKHAGLTDEHFLDLARECRTPEIHANTQRGAFCTRCGVPRPVDELVAS